MPGVAAAASAHRGGLEPRRQTLRDGRVRRQRRDLAGRASHSPVTRSTRPRRSRRCRSTGRRCSWEAALTSDSSTSRPGGRRRSTYTAASLRQSSIRQDRSLPSRRGSKESHRSVDRQCAHRPRDQASARDRDPVVRVQPGREAACQRQLRPDRTDLGRPDWQAPTRARPHGLRPRRALFARRPLARHLELRTALRTSGTLRPAGGSCSSSGVPARWAPSTPPPSARTEPRSPPPPPTGSGRSTTARMDA